MPTAPLFPPYSTALYPSPDCCSVHDFKTTTQIWGLIPLQLLQEQQEGQSCVTKLAEPSSTAMPSAHLISHSETSVWPPDTGLAPSTEQHIENRSAHLQPSLRDSGYRATRGPVLSPWLAGPCRTPDEQLPGTVLLLGRLARSFPGAQELQDQLCFHF